MVSLLKSDLYRLVHGKSLPAAALVMAIGTLIALGALQAAASTDSLPADSQSFSIMVMGNMMFDASSPTRLLGNILIATGLLNLVSCVFAALVLAVDFDTGFVKNIWSTRENRKTYMAEKLLLCALCSAFLLLIGIVAAAAGSFAAGIPTSSTESPSDLMLWVFLAWLTTTAYLFITAAIVLIFRSKALGTTTAILLGTGILGRLITAACALIAAPVAASLLPFANCAKLAAGSVGITGIAGHLAFVACAVIALCTGATLAFGARRDA